MNIKIAHKNLKEGIVQPIQQTITISGSKSESNRLLILQQYFKSLQIENLSDSDDSVHLEQALKTSDKRIDIGHAGTAMRFLTAYFANKENSEVILTGSERMQNRPIGILVEALQSLGANIQFVEKEGYPPLKITGKTLTKDKVQINGNVSSQYISALMLMAPSLVNGLEIELVGKITSVPYIKMTLTLLHELNVKASFVDNKIKVSPANASIEKQIVVESDWSSASYFYSIVAIAAIGTEIKLSAYKQNSLQGDSCLAQIYKHFGIATEYQENTIILKKETAHNTNDLNIDLKSAPDIAQTIAVTCFALGVACNLTGLHTLKIKETDRLEALKAELTKLGAEIEVTNETLHLKVSKEIKENITIATYNDHRMAMAFAPLALKVPIIIEDAKVVTKSYRSFWEHMELIGIESENL